MVDSQPKDEVIFPKGIGDMMVWKKTGRKFWNPLGLLLIGLIFFQAPVMALSFLAINYFRLRHPQRTKGVLIAIFTILGGLTYSSMGESNITRLVVFYVGAMMYITFDQYHIFHKQLKAGGSKVTLILPLLTTFLVNLILIYFIEMSGEL